MSNSTSSTSTIPPFEPIAIVGMGCRFPGANDPSALWRVLVEGTDAVREIPPERWDIDAFYDPAPGTPNRIDSRRAGMLDGVDQFDAKLFKISGREAGYLDPQQRLLLEVTWQAFEDAFLPVTGLAGSRTSVYVGAGAMDYTHLQLAQPEVLGAYSGTGNALSIIANRLSYVFDFRGPSATIDTACSSSLVALQLACRSLVNGEADTAVAGGVNLLLTPWTSISFSHARMLSPTGRCRPFDAHADGYVRGEGCGVVVLQRLCDALAQKRPIRAVIRSIAVNQDGRSNGLTAPNGIAQQAVIREALVRGQLEADDVSYVEAHGTGTPLGDPIECRALVEALAGKRKMDNALIIGSVKGNIGHLETASGIAGIVKAVLCLEHEEIPGQLGCEQVNTQLGLAGVAAKIATSRQPWPTHSERRIAGVSSFGFGGTNAHALLERAPPRSCTPANGSDARTAHVLTVSAVTESALWTRVRDLRAHVASDAHCNLGDLCHWANAGRAPLEYRVASVASTPQDLLERLTKAQEDHASRVVHTGRVKGRRVPPVALMFSGQGAQYRGMARQLYVTHPKFRAELERCAKLLEGKLPWPLLDCLHSEDGPDLTRTALAQPTIFCVDYCLAQLWIDWGVRPDAVIGHSLGEYVAACIAGVFSLPDALELVVARARLMEALPDGGGMMTVMADEGRVALFLEPFAGRVELAGVNAPNLVTVSGPHEDLANLAAKLESGRIRSKLSRVSHAFHSALIEPMLDEYRAVLDGVKMYPPAIALIGNVTGRPVQPDVEYWLRHAREPVRFAQGISSLVDEGFRVFLEAGPAATLVPMARRAVGRDDCVVVSSLPARGSPCVADDWSGLTAALARLWVAGVNVDWAAVDRGIVPERVALPGYPFERSRYWVGAARASLPGRGHRGLDPRRLHPLLARRSGDSGETSTYVCELDLQSEPVLGDHRVGSRAILSGAAILEMALAAARNHLGEPVCELANVRLLRPIQAGSEGRARIEVRLKTDADGRQLGFCVRSQAPAPRTVTAPTRLALTVPSASRFRLMSESPGSLDALRLVPFFAPVVGPGQVELEVHAAGINFMDLLKGLGLYPGAPDGELALGSECSGKIVSVGPGVQGLSVGDDVIAIAPGAIASHTITGAHLVVRRPAALSAQQGATTPIAFVTAWYAMKHLARLSQGESILLHSASGGVGLAAIRIAELLGLKVFATAGSDSRRQYLRDLGIECVMDSRCTDFGTQVLDATGGRGVDAVLSSLTGDAFARNLDVLAPYGRLLEIGKLDIYDDSQIGLYPFRRNLSLFAIDIARVAAERPAVVQELLQELMRHFISGALAPLPLRAFAVEQSEAALRHMALRRHIGKIAIDVERTTRQSAGSGEGWIDHARGQIVRETAGEIAAAEIDATGPMGDLPAARSRCKQRVGGRELYGRFGAVGLDYGPWYQSVDTLDVGDGEAVAHLKLPSAAEDEGYLLHPSLLDGALQAIAGVVGTDVAKAETHAFVPVAFGRLRLLGRVPERMYAHVQRKAATGGDTMRRADVVLYTTSGARVAVVEDIDLQQTSLAPTRTRVDTPLFLRPVWTECGLPEGDQPGVVNAVVDDERGQQPQETWLLFADTHGVATACAARLHARGDRTVLVRAGSEFREDADGFTLAPGSGPDFARLLQTLAQRGLAPTGVIHFWTCAVDREPAADLGALDDGLRRGVSSLFHLLGALPKHAPTISSVLLVTTASQAVDDAPVPERSAAWTFLRAASREWPRLRCAAVDLDPEHKPSEMAELVHRELLAAQRGVPGWVAWRGKRRLRAELCPMEPPSQAAQPDFVDGGVYLITGGQSGLGLEIARFIARRAGVRMVLVNRREPDQARREGIAMLRELGAEVVAAHADVGNLESMRGVVEQMVERWGRIDGVVHAAGLIRDGLIAQASDDFLESTFQAKVRGTWVVDHVTRGQDLRFFALFSSISALLAPPGQANYAASNAYMDAFAHHRRVRLAQPACAINWGPWGQTGLAANDKLITSVERQGLLPLDNDEGVAAFSRAVATRGPQVAIVRTTSSQQRALLARYPGGGPWSMSSVRAGALPQDPSLAAPVRGSEGLRGWLKGQIVTHMARSLHVEPDAISEEDTFVDQGLDSLIGVEIVELLRRDLAVDIRPQQLFDHPSVRELVDHFMASELSTLERVYTEHNENAEAGHTCTQH